MWTGLGLLVVLVAIQFVPYGRDHTNPAGGREIAWDSPRTEQLMADACMDCHSNVTKWPWYSNVALISWLVQRGRRRGRRAQPTGEVEVEEVVESTREGSMPPRQYKPTPWRAVVRSVCSDSIRGLEATFGGSCPERRKRGE